MLRYEDFQYTFRNVGSEFKSCVSLEIPWQETADMTKKIKSKFSSATAEKALTVGKQPAQLHPDAAFQPGNEWVFRYELRYPSSCGLLCWISSVVFVRCTPLALSAGKKEKSKKKSFFLSLPERMCCTFFLHTFSPRKTGKVEKKIFLCPNACVALFFSAYLFPAKNGKNRKKKSFFLSLPERTCVFFVSAYLFPAKNGKNRKISRRRSPTAVGFKQWSNFATQDGLMMAGTGFHSLSLFGDFLPALPRPLLDQRQDETCSLRKRA